MKKLDLLLMGIVCASITISCEKTDKDSPGEQTENKKEMPISMVYRYYNTSGQNVTRQSIYTFPDMPSKNKIEYNRLDSSFINGGFTYTRLHHREYFFDPVSKHLVKSSGFTKDDSVDPLSYSWENTFDFSGNKAYPDTITIVNYINHILTPGFKFSLDRLYWHIILYDQNLDATLSYQLILNKKGEIRLIDMGDYKEAVLRDAIPRFYPGDINHYTYLLDSAENCRQLILQHGLMQSNPDLSQYFQPAIELRSSFVYDRDSEEIKNLLGNFVNWKDAYWERIAVRYSQNNELKEPFYYFQKICRSYTDSIFTISGKTSYFYSEERFQNEITRDQKGRISSLKCKNNLGLMYESFDFFYAN